ncbi:PREDICTED: myelin P2 protein-like [Gekko japonicus]|uniref:Myelin P2 protein-like n=1 Tax=Gekko japonicus TaxID=146911 RepID=A0ABM1L4N1_GEKJA|nr:PREDICTED: myelin P2 protein-like [Gekko japonicus]
MANLEVFLGKWSLLSSDNFDDYMKELGVNLAMRKMGSMAKPDVTFSMDGDTVKVKTESTFKSSEFCFKLNEKFNDNTIDGRKTETLITLGDDNVLIEVQKWDGKETTITRKVVDGKMIVECVMNNVRCTRVYKKA